MDGFNVSSYPPPSVTKREYLERQIRIGQTLVYATPREILGYLDEIDRLTAELERMSLAYIEASNPGIDMDDVERCRRFAQGHWQHEACPSTPSDESDE